MSFFPHVLERGQFGRVGGMTWGLTTHGSCGTHFQRQFNNETMIQLGSEWRKTEAGEPWEGELGLGDMLALREKGPWRGIHLGIDKKMAHGGHATQLCVRGLQNRPAQAEATLRPAPLVQRQKLSSRGGSSYLPLCHNGLQKRMAKTTASINSRGQKPRCQSWAFGQAQSSVFKDTVMGTWALHPNKSKETMR